MLRPEVETLLQGALDDTLTPEERATLRRLMADSDEVRRRAADLDQLAQLLGSLGAVDAPPRLVHDVLAQISNSTRQEPVLQFVRSSTVAKRGVTVNKKIIFGLAAAAAIVLAVITYRSYPPATVGTEATIGAAQRAQAPQIAAKDVGLGDTSTQALLQSETWDQIMKDAELRTLLQDAGFRQHLLDRGIRESLMNEAVVRALQGPNLARLLSDQAFVRQLDDAALINKLDDTNIRYALKNEAFYRAVKNPEVRGYLVRPGIAAALSRGAFQNALKDRNFDAAIRNDARFEAALARGSQSY